MNRLTVLRIAWVLTVAILAAAVFAIWFMNGRRTEILFLALIVLLIPGRIQGFFFRDLFTGRRLMDAGNHKDAVVPLSSFIDQARVRPIYRHLIWLSWPGYSINPLAMALNNRGTCFLKAGDLDAAERDLQEAITLDAQSPLPYLNLALVHAQSGRGGDAQRLLERAAELGYGGNRLDRFQMAVSSALARVEGRSHS